MKSSNRFKSNFALMRTIGLAAAKTIERTLIHPKKYSFHKIIHFVAYKPATRREQLLIFITCFCVVQMIWTCGRKENLMNAWLSETLIHQPEPGQPPLQHSYLPATQVMPVSDDDCANALAIPKVALMFLTTGPLYHEETWRLWFKSAAGVVPKQSLLKSVWMLKGLQNDWNWRRPP